MSKQRSSALIWLLLVLVVVLSLAGLFFVFEASTAESFNQYGHQYHFVKRQAIWLAIGFSVLLGVKFIPIHFWKKTSPFLFITSLILMTLTLIPGIGLELNGARRWIKIGSLTTFQPVELMKLSVVLYFSSWMSEHQKLSSFLFLTALPSILLLLQPDLGSLLILLVICIGLYFVAGGKIKTLVPVVGVGALLLGAAIAASPYRVKRFKTFLNPHTDPLGASFHVRQITLALGSGGWFGLGLGNSQQKYAYIPEASSDSIFAIVAEEIGFIGSSIIILLFAFYFALLLRSAQTQEADSYGRLVSLGVLIWLASQVCLNLAAVVVLVPLTGLPLPFFSYGGSSLVMVLLANGLVLRSLRKK